MEIIPRDFKPSKKYILPLPLSPRGEGGGSSDAFRDRRRGKRETCQKKGGSREEKGKLRGPKKRKGEINKDKRII